MRSRRRLYAARLAAIVFLAAGGFKTWQATTQGDPIFYVDAVVYLGLAAVWNEIAREENHR